MIDEVAKLDKDLTRPILSFRVIMDASGLCMLQLQVRDMVYRLGLFSCLQFK